MNPFIADLTWKRDALCREYPHISWFPSRGEACHIQKEICRACVVREECLAFALRTNETFGIWGGQSARERQKTKKAQRRLAVVA